MTAAGSSGGANALASDLGVTVTSTEDFEEVLRRYVARLSGIEVQIEQDGCTEVAWPPLAGCNLTLCEAPWNGFLYVTCMRAVVAGGLLLASGQEAAFRRRRR